MNNDMRTIGDYGILPIITLDDSKDAVPVIRALKEAGIGAAEVTFRTSAAEQAILNIVKAFPDMTIGAGTILSIENVRRAVDAGARFLLSPGLNPKVVEYCVSHGICIIPGCSCPTDIESAMEYGLDVLKIFPVEQMGGIAMFKAMTEPYRNIKYVPTGGINAQNMADYLAIGKVLACGGSWLTKPELVRNAGVYAAAKEAVKQMLGFEFAHIGVNSKDDGEARDTAQKYNALFDFATKEGQSSIFADTGIEVVKSKGLGDHGHIAIKTNDIARAVFYLKNKGCFVDESSVKTTPDGKMIAVYLKEPIGGFAVHLLQK